MTIKTRFAPSPTGDMHIGSARAALLPYMFTKKHNGQFLLRIDDTDTQRSEQKYIDNILIDLKWLNINYDYSFKQTNRIQQYDAIFQLLKDKDLIYECFETEEDLQFFRLAKQAQKKPPIFTKLDRIKQNGQSYWRYELKQSKYILNDLIMNTINFNKDWSDPIIKKSNGSYTYLFASVIDDISENITHIIRGNEHTANGVIQKEIGDNICQVLHNNNWKIQFAHYPLFIDDNGGKISKRNMENTLDYFKQFDFRCLWSLMSSFGTSKNQIFSLDINDYIEYFDLYSCSKSVQKFNIELFHKTNHKIIRLYDNTAVMDLNIDLNDWNLLKDNGDSITHLKELISHLHYFINQKNELYLWLKSLELNDINEQINAFCLKQNKDYKHFIISIYQDIFHQNYGPNIKELALYIQNNK